MGISGAPVLGLSDTTGLFGSLFCKSDTSHELAKRTHSMEYQLISLYCLTASLAKRRVFEDIHISEEKNGK